MVPNWIRRRGDLKRAQGERLMDEEKEREERRVKKERLWEKERMRQEGSASFRHQLQFINLRQFEKEEKVL